MERASVEQYFVYIVKCADGDFYVGVTSDVRARVNAHNAGRGPRYTACRLPVSLVYSEPAKSLDQARQREIQIKKWSRAKKQALIKGDLRRLHDLAKRRQ